ncbi:Mbov_0401 family ICE element transposase-like protein [Mycoplasma leachii]|uniref:Transposase n=1 Tax=Mycoplasma leachii 06049 TaxID=1188244 RepID=A0A2T4IAT2_9MOLU|nr:UPF0236 family protein [Mycoplasma leachii]PTD31807.1 hypothetical protein MLEAa_0190 [Mycoplasma leachii 06049]
MSIKIDIFNNEFLFLKELYSQKADEINQIEKHFREVERKKLHPNWRIFRRSKRKWVTLAGVFELNITMYETTNELTNKITRFTYYHHDKLKELKFSKYDIDNIKFAIKSYLDGSHIPSFLRSVLPSKQLLNHYLQTLEISKKIEQKNKEKLDSLKTNLFNWNDQIYIEMDDLYINHQAEKKKKMRVREIIFHTQKNNKLENVLNLFFTKNLDERLNEFNDLNFVFNTIKEITKQTKTTKKIVVNGDGARWIKKLAEKLNLDFSLDLFHIRKALNIAFGFNKFAFKENKKLFKTWYNKTFNLSWKKAFECAIFTKNLVLFKQLYNQFLTESKTKNVSKTILLNAKNFYKLIINNSNYVFNKNQKLSSYTEHFVYNSFKKHIKKEQSLFCFKNIKSKIIYKNLLKNQITIFY